MKYLLSLIILISILSGCTHPVKENDHLIVYQSNHTPGTDIYANPGSDVNDSFTVTILSSRKTGDKNTLTLPYGFFDDGPDSLIINYVPWFKSWLTMVKNDSLIENLWYDKYFRESDTLDHNITKNIRNVIDHYKDSLNHLKKTPKKKHKSSMILGGEMNYGGATTGEDSGYINSLRKFYLDSVRVKTYIDTNTVIYDKATGIGINDLVPVIMQVSDTSIHYTIVTSDGTKLVSNNLIEWINGYEGYKTYHDDLPGIPENVYLDENKKPLSKSIVIWTTKPRQ